VKIGFNNRVGVCGWTALALGLSALVSHADSVTINPSKDNTIWANDASLSNGSGVRFFSGRDDSGRIKRALLAFDVAGSVPCGATVTSAVMRLNMSKTSVGAKVLNLHRLLADWGEAGSNSDGTGGGAPAQAGDATWTNNFFTTSSWATPGGDYTNLVSAAMTVSVSNSYTWTDPQLAADVQDMLDSASGDYGCRNVLVQQRHGAVRFRNQQTARGIRLHRQRNRGDVGRRDTHEQGDHLLQEGSRSG